MRETQAVIAAIDRYVKRVYKTAVLIGPMSAGSVGVIYFLRIWLWKWEPTSWIAFWIYQILCVGFITSGMYFKKRGIGPDGNVIPKMYRASKINLAIIVLIQWEFLNHLGLSIDLWAIAPFFILCGSFFFDYKYVILLMAEVSVPMVIKMWRHGELFKVGLTDHILFPMMTMGAIIYLTYCGGKYLVDELEKNANYDTLTRLLNRRTLNATLEKCYKEACEGEAPFALIMADIDDFKKVNDTEGHEFGDVVLREVSKIISRGVQKQDIVFRWGGEEILIILFAEGENVLRAANRIREDISKDPIADDNHSASVTVTMGVSHFDKAHSIQEMLEEADANLYVGKNAGKNQVVSNETK